MTMGGFGYDFSEEPDFTGATTDSILAGKKLDQEDETRVRQYLEDLKEILRLPSGAGMRVIYRWLSLAYGWEKLSTGNSATYYLVGMYEWARARMADLAMADPKAFLKMELEGVREFARQHFNEKRKGKE